MSDRIQAKPSKRKTKQGAVIAAAEKLFLRDGYANTSMEAIAQEAGVIKQTVYRYYRGKEELFGSVVNGVGARTFAAGVVEFPAEGDVRTALIGFARQFIDLHTDDNAVSIYRLVVAEAHRFPDLARTFLANGPAAFIAKVSDYLGQQQRTGHFAGTDPERAAAYLLSMLLAPFQLELVLGTRLRPHAMEIESIAEETVDRFLRAYAGPGDSGFKAQASS